MEIDVLIVDGGPAGLAVAVQLCRKGTHDILIVEQEKWLGGILRQCIHDGFGLTRFKTILSESEHVQRFIREVEELGIPCITDTTVLEVAENRTVMAATHRGLKVRKAKSVVLTMGCKERTRDALGVPGKRPTGAFTVEIVQAYTNPYNVMSAKEVVILGSRDIGMTMARRLTLEGAHVQAAFEIQLYPSDLPRNTEQCLNDHGMPLYLSHAITTINGGSRLTGVMVSRVDEHLRPVPGTEGEYKCDTLILSMRLIPEDELLLDADMTLDDRAKGAVVDEHFQTDTAGIFAAGNVFYVRNLVDFVSIEAGSLASSAAEFVQKGYPPPCPIGIGTDNHINHIIPQRVNDTRDFKLPLKVNSSLEECYTEVRQDGVLMTSEKMKRAIPAEMTELMVKTDELVSVGRLEVSAEC